MHPLLLNGVMVALQILVLSVWVRVLVEQLDERGHKQQVTSFFLLIPTRTQVLIFTAFRTIIAPPLRSVDYCFAIFESWLSNLKKEVTNTT